MEAKNESSVDGKTEVLISGFLHRPGKNCGSTALWNVSSFWGNDTPEHVIFGLASGLLFFYTKGMVASHSIGGRNPVLVEDFFENIGYPERKWQKHLHFPDEKIKESVKKGIPVLARTDLFYLGYYPKPVHFPGHELVVFGYRKDGEEFIVSDSSFDEPQRVSRENLAKAMHPDEKTIPFFDLENHILPVEEFKVDFSPKSVVMAIGKVVERMTREIDFMGLSGMRRFVEEIYKWLSADDSAWAFRFAYQVIERRGTGGGAFRFMYSDFLKDSAELFSGEKKRLIEQSASLMRESAELWRELAFIFKDISVKLGYGGNTNQGKNVSQGKNASQGARVGERKAGEKESEEEIAELIQKARETAKSIYEREKESFEILKKLF